MVLPGAAPGLPLPVALVDDGLVLALKERIRSMAMQVVGIRKDAQYQVGRQWFACDKRFFISMFGLHWRS